MIITVCSIWMFPLILIHLNSSTCINYSSYFIWNLKFCSKLKLPNVIKLSLFQGVRNAKGSEEREGWKTQDFVYFSSQQFTFKFSYWFNAFKTLIIFPQTMLRIISKLVIGFGCTVTHNNLINLWHECFVFLLNTKYKGK